jgi:hypothetical protein
MAKRRASISSDSSLDGDGLLDIFRGPRNDYNNASQKIIAEYGDWPIIEITLQRTPIRDALTKVLNVMSLGAFARMSKKQGIDRYYHLAMLITVVSPTSGLRKILTVEKNHVINISARSSIAETSEVERVRVEPGLTLKNMLNRARAKMGDTFFKYDAFQANCQDFLKNLLSESGLLTPVLNAWLFQDISEIAKRMPLTRFLAKKVTDAAALFDRVVGNGLPPETAALQAMIHECLEAARHDTSV